MFWHFAFPQAPLTESSRHSLASTHSFVKMCKKKPSGQPHLVFSDFITQTALDKKYEAKKLLVRTLNIFTLRSVAFVRVLALVPVRAKRSRIIELETPRTNALEAAVGVFATSRGRTKSLRK